MRRFPRIPLVLLGLCLGTSLAVVPVGASRPVRADRAAQVAEASPTEWAPWLLISADQFRLGPPPREKSRSTRRDLRELRRLQSQRNGRVKKRIRFWNKGPFSLRWTDVALSMIKTHKERPPSAARDLGLLHTALHDALIAAADSRDSHFRRRPSKADTRIEPLLREGGSSYAPEQVVLAGTAERMLAYLFPDEPEATFTELATEAIESRLWAGVNYRTDVSRARRLGHKVAEVFIASGETDGHTNMEGSNPRPDGEEFWDPTPPGFEQNTGGPVGTWRTLVLDSPEEARVGSAIPGPFPYGSSDFMEELRDVSDGQQALTVQEAEIAQYWDDGPGTLTPPGHWVSIAEELIRSYKPGPEEAIRILGVESAALYDASIASFEAKYHWWSIRPVTAMRRLCEEATRVCSLAELEADPSMATYPDWLPYLLTPPFPSYPGGHSTFSGTAAGVLGHYFPAAGSIMNDRAEEAAISRYYGGIHYTSDNDAGLVLGDWIAQKAVGLPQAVP